LVQHFADMINVDFTAHMETELDQIESGERRWREIVGEFNDVFMRDLGKAETDMESIKSKPILSDKLCDKCGAPMAVLFNKRGKFLGCSKYPECKNTMGVDGPREKSEVTPTDKLCEKCGKPMVIRTGSRGRFIACTGYPKCKNTGLGRRAGQPDRRAADRRQLREVRQRDGDQAVAPRPVPGVLGLSEVPQRQAAARRDAAQARGRRRRLRQVRRADGQEDLALGQTVPGVLGLSEVQERQERPEGGASRGSDGVERDLGRDFGGRRRADDDGE
jgi:ssDNA-binding Zn-finger/Zn-ribbon topoisomerase 1